MTPGQRIQHIQHISRKKHILGKTWFLFRGNVEYVELWGPMVNQNVLLSAEMLNVLNVLGGN